MKPQTALLLTLGAAWLALCCLDAMSIDTHTWLFDDPDDYFYSNVNDIEVSDGEAKLRLRGKGNYVAEVGEYATNSAAASDLALGADISLRLAPSGGGFVALGTFESRIIDGGAFGNVWQNIRIAGHNFRLDNAFGGIPSEYAGLVALYRLDNDAWRDVVTGTVGDTIPGTFGTPSFETVARIGTHSAYFPGYGYGSAVNSALLDGVEEFTLCCWIRRWGPKLGVFWGAADASDILGFRGGLYGSWRFYAAGRYVQSPVNIDPTDRWFFLTAVWRQSEARIWLYVDGEFVLTSTHPQWSGRSNQSTRMTIGRDSNAYIDEAAAFDRCLLPVEIRELYERQSSIGFQIRADVTAAALPDSDYAGPDGATNTYYLAGDSALVSGGGFRNFGRYAQYRASLRGPSDGSDTPYFDAAFLDGSSVDVFDNTLGAFALGSTDGVSVYPDQVDTPHLTLNKLANGGFSTNGIYTSRPLDTGNDGFVSWQSLAWRTFQEQSASEASLMGLWRGSPGWGDASGNGVTPVEDLETISFTPFAKLGDASAVFNGSNSYVRMGSVSPEPVKSVEFWLSSDNVHGPVMQLAAGTYIAISNRLITAIGFPSDGLRVYVNGSVASRRIDAGWNHVVVASETGVVASDLYLGRVADGHFEGLLDDIALHDRTLFGSDAKARYLEGGKKTLSGLIRFSARTAPAPEDFTAPGNELALPFLGKSGANSFYDTPPTAGQMPFNPNGNRLLQYRIHFIGEGDAGPAVRWVAAAYMGDANGAFVDDDVVEISRDGMFNDGATIEDQTKWVGDEMSLYDRSLSPGLGNLDHNDAVAGDGLGALFHMEEFTWGAITNEVGSNGNALNGPQPAGGGKVGSRCGQFIAASNQYATVILPSMVDGLAIGAWFRSTASTRSAILRQGAGRLGIEFNSNGASVMPGHVAVVVDGVPAVSAVGGLNDGTWHSMVAVKQNSHVYVYIDGYCAGSAYLGAGYAGGELGGAYEVARLGPAYFDGYVDEIFAYTRALPEWEIKRVLAMGNNTVDTGIFESKVFDAGGAVKWGRIAWREEGPYGDALSEEDDIRGLWPLDGITNSPAPNAVRDSSDYGNHGTVSTGGSIDPDGRFDSCLDLSPGEYVQIDDDLTLEPATGLTVEAWVYMSGVNDRTIFDKRALPANPNDGYSLATDDHGRPVFRVGGTDCRAAYGLRADIWNHVAGTYDGAVARVFINGDSAGVAHAPVAVLTAGDARIGRSIGGWSGNFEGRIDEVAVHARALNAREIRDHARSGFADIRVQVRSAETVGDLAAEPYVGPGRSPTAYFTAAAGSSLEGIFPGDYRHFQFKALLTAEDGDYGPRMQGVTVDESSFPLKDSDDGAPYLSPITSAAHPFLGSLIGFSHTMGTGLVSQVRYQASGDGSNWYRVVGSDWEMADPLVRKQWNLASSVDDISANIGSFYARLYDKVGGWFYYRLFLGSDGDQVSVKDVSLTYSEGRVVVTVPNGAETNENSWLVGTTNAIEWVSTGAVGLKVKLEYSVNNGSSWNLIDDDVDNIDGANIYQEWRTPESASDQMLVKVTSMTDSNIVDFSDSPFSIVFRFRLLVPNGGEKWYTARTNRIRWASAHGLGDLRLDYAADGLSFDRVIQTGVGNVPSSTNNFYDWPTPKRIPELLSETGRVRIQTMIGKGADFSDSTFMLVGAEITNPDPGGGSRTRAGSPLNIRWTSAGAGSNVVIRFSGNGGATFPRLVSPDAPNSTGDSSFDWVVNALPTTNAQLLVQSTTDSNVIDYSGIFTIADIRILDPTPGTNWLTGATNTVRWLASGAGPTNWLFYSQDGGLEWTSAGTKTDGIDGTNEFDWVVPPFPGPTRLRLVSAADSNNLWVVSEEFNVAGVRVTWPNFGDSWDMGVTTQAVSWAYREAGQFCMVMFSYDGGQNWLDISGPGVGLSDEGYLYTPTNPTTRAMAMVLTTDPGYDMADVSDGSNTVAGILVVAPTNGARYTIGTGGNRIQWKSAGTVDSIDLYYVSEGTTNLIRTGVANDPDPADNSFFWGIGAEFTPSLDAQILVRGTNYSGASPSFTLRGARLTSPVLGQELDLGGSAEIRWGFAGFDPGAAGNFYLSTDGGENFDTLNPLNGTEISITDALFAWDLSRSLNPTTNAVVKLRIESGTAADVGYEADSRAFKIGGLRVLDPNAGTAWYHGGTEDVVWRAALAGNFASVYYSHDGTNSFDTANPVVENQPLVYGSNTNTWAIEPTRRPSTNARMRVLSLSKVADSDPFALDGILVMEPKPGVNLWAAEGDMKPIEWASAGVSGTFDLWYVRNGFTNPIVQVSGTNRYSWTVPPGIASPDVRIVVSDVGLGRSGYSGRSGVFEILALPGVTIVSPAPGELWPVSVSNTISWEKGGDMENSWDVTFTSGSSTVSFDTSNVWYDVDANTYNLGWIVEDYIGPGGFVVQNLSNSTVAATSDVFHVVGKFELRKPVPGDPTIYALKDTLIEWDTWGSVPEVDVLYSIDPLHGAASWTPITNDFPLEIIPGNPVTRSSFNWPPVAEDTDSVRIRVRQSDQPGAYDDSDGDFGINFYDIIWRVHSAVSSNELSHLALMEWWSGSTNQFSDIMNITSPMLHRYPYGNFDSTWWRASFNEAVVFDWSSEPSRTIEVYMTLDEQAEQDPQVFASFDYEGTTTQLHIFAWLERSGRAIENPDSCTVYIYDENGMSLTNLAMSLSLGEATASGAKGVFRHVWENVTDDTKPVYLKKGLTYLARVEIVYSGSRYWSLFSYPIRLTAEQDTADQIKTALSQAEANIQSSIGGVSNQVQDLSDKQAAFRGAVSNSLDELLEASSNLVDAVTNLEVAVSGMTGVVEQIAADVGMILPPVTSIVARLTPIETDLLAIRSRILTRPDSVSWGSTNRILYKSRPDATPTIVVSNTVPPEFGPAAMAPVVAGVFEKELVAIWGTNRYLVVCSDQYGSDSIVLNVVGGTLYDLPAMIGALGDDIDNINSNVTHIDSVITGIEGIENLVDLSTNLTPLIEALDRVDWDSLTNVNDIAELMPGILASVSNTEFMVASMGDLSNITSVAREITNLAAVVESMSGLAQLQLDVSNLVYRFGETDLDFLSLQMSNMTETIMDSVSLTNLATISDQIKDLASVVTNLSGLETLQLGVSNLVETFGAVNLTDFSLQISNMIVAVNESVSLTNLAAISAQITELATVITNLSGLATLQLGVSNLVETFGTVSLTDFSLQISNMIVAVNESVSLTNLAAISAQITELATVITNLSGLETLQLGVSNLVETFGAVNLTDFSLQISNMIAAVNESVSLTNLASVTDQLTNLVAEMEKLQDLTDLQTNVSALVGLLSDAQWADIGPQVSNLVFAVTNLQDLSVIVSGVSNAVALLTGITGLPELASNMNAVVASLEGASLAVLSDRVSNTWETVKLLGDLSALTSLTNLPDRLGGVNLAGMQTQLSNTWETVKLLGDLSALTSLTNLPDRLGGVNLAGMQTQLSNTWETVKLLGDLSALTSLTNLPDRLGGVDLAGMQTQLSNTWEAVRNLADLSGITNLNTSAVLGGLSDLEDLIGALRQGGISAGIDQIIQLLTGGAISADVMAMRDMLEAAAITELGGVDLAALSRVETALGKPGTTDRDTFFGQLAGLVGDMAALGGVSADAAKKAQTAKTQAGNAASGVNELKTLLEEGLQDPVKMQNLLENIVKSMTAAQASLDEIPKGFDIAAIERAMSGAVERLKRIALQDVGVELQVPQQPLVTAPDTAPDTAVVDTGPVTPAASKATINAMGNNIKEIESSVRQIEKIIQENMQGIDVSTRIFGEL